MDIAIAKDVETTGKGTPRDVPNTVPTLLAAAPVEKPQIGGGVRNFLLLRSFIVQCTVLFLDGEKLKSIFIERIESAD